MSGGVRRTGRTGEEDSKAKVRDEYNCLTSNHCPIKPNLNVSVLVKNTFMVTQSHFIFPVLLLTDAIHFILKHSCDRRTNVR